jgi:hypothetical protein
MKDMEDELDSFLDRINDGKPFALSRWGDGEMRLSKGLEFHRNPSDIINNRLWDFDPSDSHQAKIANLICESLRYEGEDLFWGIPCPKCSVCYVSGQEQYDLYENKDNLTFASIFVNGNHEETQRRLPQVLRGKEVIFVGHHSADVSRLPFPITKHFGVGTNAWLNDSEILGDLKEYMRDLGESTAVALFACGPLSCYLITELWKENKQHFLLDIGSAFDVELYSRPTRGFHSGKSGYGKFCEWIIE